MIPAAALRDRGAEYLSGMPQGTVQRLAGDQHLPQHLARAVERREMKLLDLQFPQPVLKQVGDVLRFPNPLHRRPPGHLQYFRTAATCS
jgi:hypothetical protein